MHAVARVMHDHRHMTSAREPSGRSGCARTGRVVGFAVLLLVGVARVGLAADAAQRERGRYLAHDVAMCVQCHTPRDETGALIAEQEFMGAPFPVGSPSFIPEGAWCVTTPRIAGLPGFSDAEAVEFFMNGARLGRHQPKWPMPPFHLSRSDAEALVAYLRALPETRTGSPEPR
jgi:hypothetical protein